MNYSHNIYYAVHLLYRTGKCLELIIARKALHLQNM